MPRALMGLAIILAFAAPAAGDQDGALFELSDGAARPLKLSRKGGIEGPAGPARGLLSRALNGAAGAPAVQPLGGGRALILWRGEAEGPLAYAEVENRGGRLIERASGPWPAGWMPGGAGDFDRDGRVDLLMIRREGSGDRVRYEYLIARGQDRGFRLPVTPLPATRMLIVARSRGCHFAVADINGDGAADLLFHVVPHDGPFHTRLFVQYGDGRGHLKHRTHILASIPDACGNIAVADLDGDGDLDIILAPDDDASDEGRGAILLRAEGLEPIYKPGPPLDFVPTNARANADGSSFSIRLADLDGDGRVDLLSSESELKKLRRVERIRWGLGDGRFDDEAAVTLEDSALRAPRRPRFWLEDRGPIAGLSPGAAKALSAARVLELERALMSPEPAEAGAAMAALVEGGSAALPLLRSILVPKVDDALRLRPLIAALEDPSIAARDQAARGLAELGPGFGGALERALLDARSPEARWRLNIVIAARRGSSESFSSPIGRRRARALAIAEAVGGAEARAILRGFLRAFGQTGLGAEARAALDRMN